MQPAITAPVMRFLGAADPARAAAFYRDVLGFEIRDGEGAVEAVRGPARLRFGGPQSAGAAMVYFEVDDVDGMRAEIAGRGAAPSEIDKLNWIKIRMFYLQDPEGHTLWFGKSYNEPSGPCPPALVEKALPELPCADVADAVAHYRDVLGFRINYQQDDLGVMDRDRVTVLLIPRKHGGAGSAYFYVADADALYAELRARGANVRGEPVTHPWGLRDFLDADGDGNELRFGQLFE